MTLLEQQVAETLAVIESRTVCKPKIAIILGTGLGELADHIENPCIIPYKELPNWKQSTAPAHKGNLIFGTMGGKEVVCMQGRLHFYEGYSLKDITYPIRVFAKLGVTTLLVSNSSGGIDTGFAPGDLMLITDHINLMGDSPLLGPNEDEFGVRFPDMTFAYAPRLQTVATRTAMELGIPLQHGVYIGVHGPTFETPAEVRMMRALGGSAVGMSTVPEVIVANHCGIEVLGISCVTNLAAGILNEPLSEEEVVGAGQWVAGKLTTLMKGIVERL